MRVVLLTSDYYIPANIAVRDFLDNPALAQNDIEVVGVVSAATFDFSPRTVSRMWRFLHASGWHFFWANVGLNIWKTVKMWFGRWFIPNTRREYFSVEEMAKRHGIPFHFTSDINSPEAVTFIREKCPDNLVSVLLLQIVNKEILAIPPLGAINFHPALTQHHRGTFTSFWALLQKWKRSGATVHFMTEGVDEGQVIVQRRFLIHPSDTMHCINKKAATLGARLLVKALIKIKRNQARAFMLKKLGEVFRMPKLEDVEAFYRQSHQLIKSRDFFKL